MTSTESGNGKSWRLPWRPTSGTTDPATAQRAAESQGQEIQEVLTSELHDATDAVLYGRIVDDAARERLRAALHGAIDGAVRKHRSALQVVESAEIGSGRTASPIDEALERLRTTAQGAFSGAKPGVASGAATVLRVMPDLLDRVVPLLSEIVQDERKVAVFRSSAVRILSRYMSTGNADRVVRMAVYAARQAVNRPKRR
jgi:hypothetical protein